MSNIKSTVPATQNGIGRGIAPREDSRIATVRGLLSRSIPEIRKALPKYMDPDRMARLALTAIRSDAKLLACTAESLIGSVMKAAQVGLEIDGILGHAYLVPFHNRREQVSECQLIVGYKGLVALARRSKQIETIEGHAVFEADAFAYQYGSSAFLKHVPARGREKGELIGAWAMTRFRGASFPQFEFLDREDIEAVRRRSRQADSGPWKTDYAAMAIKTALRRHSKIWPLSPIERTLIETEDLIEAGVELPESRPTDLDVPSLESPPTRSSQIADALEAKGAASPEEESDADRPEAEDGWELGRE